MSHAQNRSYLALPPSKFASIARGRLLMPRRRIHRGPPVFKTPTLDSLQIKPSELHALQPLPVPHRQSENRPPHLPHHIIHTPGRYGIELGIPFPATNV